MTADLSSLPVELNYHVMGCFEDDLSSLSTYSMVNKLWLAVCRTYLFRKVTLDTHCIASRFTTLILERPEIGSYVRNLRVGPRHFSFGGKERLPRFHDLLHSDVTTSLHGVQNLDINELHVWTSKDIDALSRLSSVTELSLTHCSFSPSELWSIICCFPHLRSIRLNFCSHWPESGLRADLGKPVPPVRRLRLYCFSPYSTEANAFIRRLTDSIYSLSLGDIHIIVGNGSRSSKNHAVSDTKGFTEECQSSEASPLPAVGHNSPSEANVQT